VINGAVVKGVERFENVLALNVEGIQAGLVPVSVPEGPAGVVVAV
jgi:hypothetical protein